VIDLAGTPEEGQAGGRWTTFQEMEQGICKTDFAGAAETQSLHTDQLCTRRGTSQPTEEM
jgi:hypothetical protein